jgi:hypothetical protein
LKTSDPSTTEAIKPKNRSIVRRFALWLGMLVFLYFAGLFIALPLAMTSSGEVAASSARLLSNVYAPLISRIDRKSWWGELWEDYERHWCSKSPSMTCHFEDSAQ